MLGCLKNMFKPLGTILPQHAAHACGFFKLITPFELEIVSQAGLPVWTLGTVNVK